MTTQPEALYLADNADIRGDHKTADELRRLVERNAELLMTLKWISEYIAAAPAQLTQAHEWNEIARAAIAKAEGQA